MSNFYVSISAAGSNNGTDWSNAWNEFDQISWASISPGDTIWVAGGTYSTAFNVGKSGTSGSYITIARVRTTDVVPAAAAGWSSDFDAQVVIDAENGIKWASGTDQLGSYVSIDGRVDSGIKCVTQCASWSSSGIFINTGNTGVILRNIEVAGPGGSAPYNYTDDGSSVYINPAVGYGIVTNLTVEYCRFHGSVNVFKLNASGGCTIRYSKLYDVNNSNVALHGNLINAISGDVSHPIYFYGNECWNWDSEGIMLKNVPQTWYVYNNLFRDAVGSGTPWSGVSRAISAEDTEHTVFWWNNTAVNVHYGTMTSAGTYSADSQSRNNIYWNLAGIGDENISNRNYNLSNAEVSGANSVSSASDPFINYSGRVYSLSNGGPAVGVGTILSEYFTTDINEVIRTDPWDVGAYKYETQGPLSPSSLIATAVSPSVLSLSWTNNASDADGVLIERSPNGSTGWTEIADLAAGFTSYTDTGLSSGTTYYYRVAAYNEYGSSAWSDVATR